MHPDAETGGLFAGLRPITQRNDTWHVDPDEAMVGWETTNLHETPTVPKSMLETTAENGGTTHGPSRMTRSQYRSMLELKPMDMDDYAKTVACDVRRRVDSAVGAGNADELSESDNDDDFWESKNEEVAVCHEAEIRDQQITVSDTDTTNYRAPPPRWLPMNNQLDTYYVSSTDLTMAGLYRTCEAAGAPLYLMDQIMDKVVQALSTGALKTEMITRRASLIGRTQRMMKLPVAEKVAVQLEQGDTVYVYRYNFMEMYEEHLQGEAFSNIDNLVLANRNDIWQCVPEHEPSLGEINESHWFNRTARSYEEELGSGNYILDALMLYIDKTGTDRMQRNSLEPLMFTSTILSREARENSRNWKPLGLIPNLSSKSSAIRKTNKTRKGSKSSGVRDYHRCLSVLLAPLAKCQRERPEMTFRRGNFVKKARVICPLAVVVGDNLSNSNLCGKVMNYKASSMRMGRRCLTSYSQTEQTPHDCIRTNRTCIRMLQMASLGCTHGERSLEGEEARTVPLSDNFPKWEVFLNRLKSQQKQIAQRLRAFRERLATDILREVLGSHSFISPFDNLEFGDNPGGIHRATVTDILHTIEEGLIPNLLAVFYGLMPAGTRGRIDELVEKLFSKGRNRSSERACFPKVSFSRGYTSLTMLSANERVGQLFVLAILLQIPEGKSILEARFAADFDERRKKKGKETFVRVLDGQVEEITSEEEETNDETESEEDDSSLAGSVREGETTTTAGTSGSVRQIRDILNSLDMGFVFTDIMPSLPESHKKALMELLQKRLTADSTSAKNAREHAGCEPYIFERGVLDYDTRWRVTVSKSIQLCSSSDRGEIIPTVEEEDWLSESTKKKRKIEQRTTIKMDMTEFRHLVELILTMHACLKYAGEDIGKEGNLEILATGVEIVRRRVRDSVMRDESTNGYNTEKFLELAHFVADYREYGAPSGYSTETGERGLKDWAKKPARRTQKGTDEIFSAQTCARIQEAAILQKLEYIAEARTSGGCQLKKDKRDGNRGSLYDKMFVFQVVKGGPGEGEPVIWRLLPNGQRERRNNSREGAYPRVIKEWFFNKYRREKKKTIHIFSELKKGNTVFRAHPNYQGNGPWFDYAMISYKLDGQEEWVDYPTRIAAFFYEVDRESGDIVKDAADENDDGWRVLVQQSKFQTKRQKREESLIMEHYTLDSTDNRRTMEKLALLREFNTEALNRRLYCVEADPVGRDVFCKPISSNFDILVIRDMRTEWHKQFLGID